MAPVLLPLLLLLGPAVPKETQTGPYTLSFLYTGLSRPGKGFPSFQAMAYLNDQPFFRYESDGRKAEPLGPWSQVEGMEDWEKESELQKAREDIFMATLRDIMDYYKDREGSHTFQGRFGCELRNDQRQAAFWRYAYDGRDFIEFNKEIPAWVALDPAAVNTKLKWEAEAVYVQRAKAYLEEECPGMLRRYLEHGRGHLDQQPLPPCRSPATWPQDRTGPSSAWPMTSTQEESVCAGLALVEHKRLSLGETFFPVEMALTSPGWWWGSPSGQSPSLVPRGAQQPGPAPHCPLGRAARTEGGRQHWDSGPVGALAVGQEPCELWQCQPRRAARPRGPGVDSQKSASTGHHHC
uniref:MHC class I-like antigen recognition-like domain-containing protein n=1 Tax=Sus scrofa TaxID=9823 RepID=A0A8D1CSW6_PIG